ncbi:MAG TPA: hypothetical protein PLD77_02105 [Candidatus Dojkabacteria bacterium]|nr:hypothetical protein [Candidatus Dojkabacteria bacterium]
MENTDNIITEKIPLNQENGRGLSIESDKVENSGGTSIETNPVETTPTTAQEKQLEKNTEQNQEKETDLPTLEFVGAGYPLPNTLENNPINSSEHKKGDITADDAIAILKKKINSNPIDVD